jgi:hypothetical protein
MGKKLKLFLLKSGMRLSVLIQYSLGIPSKGNKIGKRNKKNISGKEEVKRSLFTDDIILYLKDLKNSTKKLLDTMNSFSKVTRYTMNLQISVAFLYTNSDQIEKEIRKTIPFTIAPPPPKSNT